jgi:hypothetical protein
MNMMRETIMNTKLLTGLLVFFMGAAALVTGCSELDTQARPIVNPGNSRVRIIANRLKVNP